jgi:regulatory protein YycI of two-component signal transduction system YycFG
MDWSKSKNILIVIFIILNIFLLSATIFSNSYVKFMSGYVKYAENYLESRNIKIDTKIQDKTGKRGIMAYGTKTFDFARMTKYVFGHEVNRTVSGGTILYSEGNERIELSGDELSMKIKLSDSAELLLDHNRFLQRALEIIEEAGFKKRDLVFQPFTDSQTVKSLIFNLKYKDAILFDQTIKISLDEEGYLNASFPAREVKRINKTDNEVLSIYQVLVMSNLPDGSVIKSVNFGYKQISKLYDTPVWRVVLGSNKVIFYNAYTGQQQ